MNINEKIEVMKAFAEGKSVEYSDSRYVGRWIEAEEPNWDWSNYTYRVKPTVSKMISQCKKNAKVRYLKDTWTLSPLPNKVTASSRLLTNKTHFLLIPSDVVVEVL